MTARSISIAAPEHLILELPVVGSLWRGPASLRRARVAGASAGRILPWPNSHISRVESCPHRVSIPRQPLPDCACRLASSSFGVRQSFSRRFICNEPGSNVLPNASCATGSGPPTATSTSMVATCVPAMTGTADGEPTNGAAVRRAGIRSETG